MNIAKDAGVRNAVRIAGNAGGPRVVMFSGVHGDEVSGIHALEKLFFDLYAGTRVLACFQLGDGGHLGQDELAHRAPHLRPVGK